MAKEEIKTGQKELESKQENEPAAELEWRYKDLGR